MNCTKLLFSKAVFLTVPLALAMPLPAADEAGDEIVELVVGLLLDKDKDIRALALEQVRSEAKGPAATRQFAAQLPKLSPDGQAGLLSALAGRGDVAARPAVLEVLAASDQESVRVAAVAALGELGELADTQVLVGQFDQPSSAAQSAARTSLIRLRGDGVPQAIAGASKTASPALRVTLIEILAARRALETIPDLLSAAVAADPTVRAAAMTALGQLAGPEHIPGMVQGVLRAERGREREAAEKHVMLVCSRIADPDRRAEPLLTEIVRLPESDRRVLLPTLGRVGGPTVRRAVEAVIANPDPQVHEVGFRALCNWPDASVASRLIELANSDDHAAHRIAALRALIRIAPLPDERTDEQRLALLQQAMSMCTRDTERILVLDRARAIRTLAALHFVASYIDQPPYAERACLSVVELAHHRTLREPNKAEFDRVLDKVIQTSKDPVVIDRANRYKKDQTWVRPTRSD